MDDEWLLNSAMETSGKHLHTFPLLENERVYESASRKKHPASRPKLTETTAPCDPKYAAHKSRVWEEYDLGGELVQLVGSSFSCYESDGLVWLTSSQQEDDEGNVVHSYP